MRSLARHLSLATLVGVLLIAATSTEATASSAPRVLGQFDVPAISDRQSVAVLGSGPATAVLIDSSTALRARPMADGCAVTNAASGTGLVQCGTTGTLPQLVHLTTGALRALPGAAQPANREPGGVPTYAYMGRQWLAGSIANGHNLGFILNWRTGAFQWKDVEVGPTLPTNLDSPTFAALPAAPRVITKTSGGNRSATSYFVRGRVTKLLNRGCVCSQYVVSGSRVAWLSAGDLSHRGQRARTLHVVNVKTGRKASVALSGFSGFAQGNSESWQQLAATNGRLIVSVPVPIAGKPGYYTWTVSTAPWPV